MIPISEPFRQPTQITFATFEHEAKKKGMLDSPLFNGVSDKRHALKNLYDEFKNHEHAAEIWLGIAGKEHTWGTNPNSVLHRGDTRSWTNARSVIHPNITPRGMWHDPLRNSDYVQYKDVVDSGRDGRYRIDDPDYAYKDAYSIYDVTKIWAPSSDGNKPRLYAEFLGEYAYGLRQRETPVLPGGDMIHVPWIPADLNHYTPGRKGVVWPDRVILHHTDGWDSLSWLTTSPKSNVSSTYLLNHDGTPRAQLVRHADTPHTTGYMNRRSLSVEWERKWPVQKDISDQQYLNIGLFVADMVRVEQARGNPEFVIFEPIQLADHNDFYATTCPGNLDTSIVWEIANDELMRDKPDTPERRTFPNTGRVIQLGFKAFWEELELHSSSLPYRVLGYPVTNEGKALLQDESWRTVQFFERGVLTWNEGVDSPWDLTLMHRHEAEGIVMFSENKVA